MGILRSSVIRNSAIRSTLNALRALAIRADGTDGVALDPFLPTSYKDLLLWQTADEGVTTVNATANQDLSSWTLSGQNAVVGGQADPVGGNAAYLLTETNTNALHFVEAAWVGTRQNGDAEFDVYVKRASGTRNVAIGSASSAAVIIDLSTGAYARVDNAVNPYEFVTVQSVGSGWYRVRMLSAQTVNPLFRIFINNSTTAVASYAGDGTSGVYVYSAAYGKQRMVSAVAIKDGEATVASVQGTAGSRPFLINDPLINGNLAIGTHRTANTKSLTDDPFIATKLSGSDKPFTITWLCRSSQMTALDGFVLSGATANAKPLVYSTYKLSMSRKDDAAVTVTPTFGTTDFTNDQTWHVVSVVFSGTTAKLFIDGRQSPTTFALDVGTCTFTSAVETFISRYWREKVIYSRALTDTERANVEAGIRLRAGITLDLESPLSVPGVQGWWEPSQTFTNQVLLLTAEASIAADLTTWTPTGLTATGASPYTLTESANNAFLTGPAISGIVAGQAQFTVALKKSVGGRQWVFLSGDSGSTKGAYFDLDNGLVGTLVNATATIAAAPDIGAGWYRCSIVYTYAAGSPRIYVASADGSIATTNTGVAAYEAQSAASLQSRINTVYSAAHGRQTEAQATTTSQPFLFGTSFIPAQRIGNVVTFGDVPNVAARSLTTATGYPVPFAGDDIPCSTVMLMKKHANPGANVSMIRFAGSPSLSVLPTLLSTGNTNASRTDDLSTTATAAFGALTSAVHIVSTIFTGTQVSQYVDGVQLGLTQALDVGNCNLNGTLQLNDRATTRTGVIVVNRELTAQERTDLETGLQRRAGLI